MTIVAGTWSVNNGTLTFTETESLKVIATIANTNITDVTNFDKINVKSEGEDGSKVYTFTLNDIISTGDVTLTDGGGLDEGNSVQFAVASTASPNNNGAKTWSYNQSTATATYGQPKTAGYTLNGKTATYTAATTTTLATVTGVRGTEGLTVSTKAIKVGLNSLGTSTIELSAESVTAGYTIALADELTEEGSVISTTSNGWVVSGTDKLFYGSITTQGFKNGTDGDANKKIIYHTAVNPTAETAIVTISALTGSNLEFNEGSDYSTLVSFDDSEKTVTLPKVIVGAQITIATAENADDQYSFATLDAAQKPSINFQSVTVNAGTATVAGNMSSGYVLSNSGRTATGQASETDVTFATISGLASTASEDNVVLNDSTITIGKDALKNGNVTLTASGGDYGYELALGDDVRTQTQAQTESNVTYRWVKSGTTATLVRTELEYYTLSDGTITYTPANPTNVAIVTGLPSDFTVNNDTEHATDITQQKLYAADGTTEIASVEKVFDTETPPSLTGYTVTLQQDALPTTANATVTIATGKDSEGTDLTYTNTFELASGIATSANPTQRWVQGTTNYDYVYEDYTPAYYTKSDSDKTITCTAREDSTTLFTIKGLASGLLGKTGEVDNTSATTLTGVTPNKGDHAVKVTAAALNKTDVSVEVPTGGTGYTLSYDNTDNKIPVDTATKYCWTQDNNGNLVYNSYVKENYQTKGTGTSTTIDYTAETELTEEFTLSGELLQVTYPTPAAGAKVASLETQGVTVSSNTVTVTKAAVKLKGETDITVASGDDVTLTNGTGKNYTISLGTDFNDIKAIDSSTAWDSTNAANHTYTYRTTTRDYYSTTSTSATYYDATTTTHLTLSGNALNALTFIGGSKNVTTTPIRDASQNWAITGYKVELAESAVKTSDFADNTTYTISLANGTGMTNELKLASTISTVPTTTKAWSTVDDKDGNKVLKYTSTVSAYYSYSGGTYTYHAADPTELISISGLKNDISVTEGAAPAGVTLNNGVVTLDNRVLTANDVTLTGDGYKLAFATTGDNKVNTYGTLKDDIDFDLDLTDNAQGKAYIKGGLAAGYTLNDDANKITYTAASTSADKILAFITGLNSDTNEDTYSWDGYKLILKAGALTSNSVQLYDTGYESLNLALDGAVVKEGTARDIWSLNGTTATYKSQTNEYWTAGNDTTAANNNSISYYGAADNAIYATISGLNADQLVQDGNTIKIKKQINKSDNSGVENSVGNVAFTVSETEGNKTITINKDVSKTGTEEAATETVSALSMADGSEVSLSNGPGKTYSLALVDDLKYKESTAASWTKVNGSNSASYQAPYQEGYSGTGTSLSYHAEEASHVYVTITGLKSDLTSDNLKSDGSAPITIDNGVITIPAAAIDTTADTVELTLSDNTNYTLKIGDYATEAVTNYAWAIADNKATFKSTVPAYYTYANGKYTWHKEVVTELAELSTDKLAESIVAGTGANVTSLMLSGSPVVTVDTQTKKVTLTSGALNQKTVTLTPKNDSDYTLAVNGVAEPADNDTLTWVQDGTTATTAYLYKGKDAGYTLADNTLTYAAANKKGTKLLTITNLKNIAANNETKEFTTGFTVTDGVITIPTDNIPTTNAVVTLELETGVTGYKLTTEGAKSPTPKSSTEAWAAVENTTGSFKLTYKNNAYYNITDGATKITYVAEADAPDPLVTISGLNNAVGVGTDTNAGKLGGGETFAEWVTINGKEITLKKNALTIGDVTLTNGDSNEYTLKLDPTTGEDAIPLSTWQDPQWTTATGSPVNYAATETVPASGQISYVKFKSSGYEVATGGKSVTYYPNSPDNTLFATVSGLKQGASTAGIRIEDINEVQNGELVVTGYKVVLPMAVLTNENVTVSNASGMENELALAADVTTAAAAKVQGFSTVTANNKTSLFIGSVQPAYYTLDEGVVTYHPDVIDEENYIAEVSGLKDGIVIYKDDLGKYKVSTSVGGSSYVSVDQTSNKITLDENILPTAEGDVVQVAPPSDEAEKYSLVIADSLKTTEGDAAWYKIADSSNNNTVAVLKTKYTKDGYVVSDDQTTITRHIQDTDATTLVTVSGLKDTSEITGISVDDKVIKLAAAALPTIDGATVSIPSDSEYTLKLDGVTNQAAKDVWSYNNGTLYLKNVTYNTYTVDSTGKSITFKAEHTPSDAEAILHITGIATGLSGTVGVVDKVLKVGTTEIATIENGKITLKAAAKGAQSDIELTVNDEKAKDSAEKLYSSYELELGAIGEPTIGSNVWTTTGANSVTATLTSTVSDGYIQASKTKLTFAKSYTDTLATITGLKSGTTATSGVINGISVDTADADGNINITLNKRVLDEYNVELKNGTENYNYKLVLSTSTTAEEKVYTSTSAPTENRWDVSNGSVAYYRTHKDPYYTLNSDKLIVYTPEQYTANLAQISGIKGSGTENALQAADFAKSTDEEAEKTVARVIINENANTITVKNRGLNEANVTLNSGSTYSLVPYDGDVAADKVTAPAQMVGKWDRGENDATLKGTVSKGYTLSGDGKTLIYSASDNIILAKLSGLATGTAATAQDSIDGITVDGTTIKLKTSVLADKSVTLTNNNGGYRISADETAAATTPPTDQTPYDGWTLNGTTAYYQTGIVPAYYETDSNGNFIYHAAQAGTTQLTITGLKSGLQEFTTTETVSGSPVTVHTFGTVAQDGTKTPVVSFVDGTKVQLTDAALNEINGAQVKMTTSSNDTYKNYTLTTNATEYASTDKVWVVNGTTANLYEEYAAGYKIVNDGTTHTLTYSDNKTGAEGKNLVTITGLNSSVTVSNESGDKLQVGSADVGTINNKIITLTAGALGNSTIVLTNPAGTADADKYTLNLDTTNVTTVSDANPTGKWFISGTTATYKSVTPAYYTYDSTNNKIIYTAEKVGATLATVKGIKSGLQVSTDGTKITDGTNELITVDGENHIIFTKDALDKANVTLTNATGQNYTLQFTDVSGKIPAAPDPTRKWNWAANGTTLTLNQVVGEDKDGYTVAGDGLSIIYTAVTDEHGTKVLTVSGLAKFAEAGTDSADPPTGVTFAPATNTVTLDNRVLTTTTVTSSSKDYLLAIGSGVKSVQDTAPSESWVINGTTLTYRSSIPAYYTYDSTNNRIIFNKESAVNDLFTLSGSAIKSGLTANGATIDGITIDKANDKIIVGSNIFTDSGSDGTGKKITLSGSGSYKDGERTSTAKADTGELYSTYKIELDSDMSSREAKAADKAWTKAANATTASYASQWSAGYKINGKTVQYAAETSELFATITGLSKDTTAEELQQNIIYSSGTANAEGKSTDTFTINGTILENAASSVTIKDAKSSDKVSYNLALADDVAKEVTVTASDKWETNANGTVAYFRNITPTYFKINTANTTITKVNQKTNKTLATVSGLKSGTEATNGAISGITVQEIVDDSGKTVNVITLTNNDAAGATNDVLDGKNVTVSGNGYILALADNNYSPELSDKEWNANSGNTSTLTLKAKNGKGYVLSTDAKKVTYVAAKNTLGEIVKISGLVKTTSDTIDDFKTAFETLNSPTATSKVIRLSSSMLGTSNVTSNNPDYTFELQSDVTTEPKQNQKYWTVSGTTATYQQSAQSAYYNYNADKNIVEYKKATTPSNLFTITGLKSGLTAFTDSEGNEVFGTVNGTTKTAYVTVADGTYNGNAVKIVTLKSGALPTDPKNNAKVILTDKDSTSNYQLVFDADDGVPVATDGSPSWVVNGTTATYVKPTSEGYTLDYNSKTSVWTATYHVATTTTLATITGLNNKIEVTSQDITDARAAATAKGEVVTKGTEDAVALKWKMETILNTATVTATDDSGKTTGVKVTLPDAILGTSAVSLKATDKTATYSLDLGADVATEAEKIRGWNVTTTTSATTATYQSYQDAYYTLNSKTNAAISYTRATNPTTWLTVSGLKSGLLVTDGAVQTTTNGVTTQKYGSIDGIQFNGTGTDTVVSLSTNVLPDTPAANSKITIKGTDDKTKLYDTNTIYYSKYELELESEDDKANLGTDEDWTYSGKNATFTNTVDAGYNVSVDGKTLTYATAKDDSNPLVLATISGLNLTVTDDEISEYLESNDGKTEAEAKEAILDERVATYVTVDSVNNTITLAKGILGTSNVTLKNGTGSSYKLALADDVATAASAYKQDWTVSGTNAYYREYKDLYYTANTAGTTITYKPITLVKNLITVSGLKSGLKAENGEITGITLDTSTKQVTLDSDVLGTGTVKVAGVNGLSTDSAYKTCTLAINADTEATSVPAEWVVSGTTAYYRTYDDAYYKANNTDTSKVTAYTYVKPSNIYNLVTITGLKSGLTATDGAIDGITESNGTITLTDSVLGHSTIKLTNGKDADGNVQEYKLAAPASGGAYTDTNEWTLKGTTATYKTYQKGYFDSAKSTDTVWTYVADKAATGTITISGLNSSVTEDDLTATNFAVDTENSKVTLKKNVLGTGTVKIAGAGTYKSYALALDGVETSPTGSNSTNEWVVSGTNAIYRTSSGEYYKPNNADVTKATSYVYTKKDATKTNLLTISGLTKGLKVEDKAIAGITLTDKTIKLDSSVLGTAKVALDATGKKNEYKLALDTATGENQVPTSAGTNYSWAISGTTSTYQSNPTAYYTLADTNTEITYTKDGGKTALFSLKGVKKGLTATGATIIGINIGTETDSDGKYTVTLDSSVLGTSNITFGTGSNKYKLAVTAAVTSAAGKEGDKAWNETVSKTATYTATTSANYVAAEDGSSITYTAPSTTTYASVKVNKENILLTDDDIDETDNTQVNLSQYNMGKYNNYFTLGGTYKFNFAVDIDTATIAGAATADIITAAGDSLVINGNAGNDQITVSGTKGKVLGGAGNDTIIISAGTHTVSGDAGNDTIEIGGAGINSVNGGAGDDTITIGGTGNNTVYGGAGADTFIYTAESGEDVIADFGTGSNKLQTSSISKAEKDGNDLVLTTGAGGKLTLKGYGKNYKESTFTYYTSSTATDTVAVTASSADLAESYDLIYDDANFTTNGLSDLVDSSADTFSVGNVNGTQNFNDLTEVDMLTYGKDDNNKK